LTQNQKFEFFRGFSFNKGKEEPENGHESPKEGAENGRPLFVRDGVENRIRRNPSSKSDFFSDVNKEHEAEKINDRVFFPGLSILFLGLAFPLGDSSYFVGNVSRRK
jgi:hypothetical protein